MKMSASAKPVEVHARLICHLKVEDERRKKRMEMRKAALDRWEGNALMADILAPAPTDGDSNGGDGAEMAA